MVSGSGHGSMSGYLSSDGRWFRSWFYEWILEYGWSVVQVMVL